MIISNSDGSRFKELLHTFSSVAGLVVPGEVSEVDVLKPRDPSLVLFVILLLSPLHCICFNPPFFGV